MSEVTITISVGAMSGPIAIQLAEQGAKVDRADMYDDNLNAITRLFLNGYITPSVAKSARAKIIKAIFKNIQPI